MKIETRHLSLTILFPPAEAIALFPSDNELAFSFTELEACYFIQAVWPVKSGDMSVLNRQCCNRHAQSHLTFK